MGMKKFFPDWIPTGGAQYVGSGVYEWSSGRLYEDVYWYPSENAYRSKGSNATTTPQHLLSTSSEVDPRMNHTGWPFGLWVLDNFQHNEYERNLMLDID